MHCGICGDTSVEVRPCYISTHDDEHCPVHGDIYLCRSCATGLAVNCTDSVFITWVGFPCDECSTTAAFDGDIEGMPEGIVCDECMPPVSKVESDFRISPQERGVWLCMDCYDKGHYGHKQKQLQPILDRLANL